MKWRYSRRMIRVRCILVETTVPVRIRPRMETRPVKGHFLSMGIVWSVTIPVTVFGMPRSAQGLLELLPAQHLICGGACLLLSPTLIPTQAHPRSALSKRYGECQLVASLDIPMYCPSMAVLGVRKPRPTSLYHRRYSSSSAFELWCLCGLLNIKFISRNHSRHPCRDAWSCSW